MAFKSIVGLGGVAVAGAWCMGLLSPGYSRTVDRTPEQVASALEDLDIRDAPGAPGSDPKASGGVAPMFSHERTGDGMVWTVMSGKDVAIRMYADLKPVDGGNKTLVTAHVERGNAPDDFVSPAFRSNGIALGLFRMQLEAELDTLTLPKHASAEHCRELIEEWRQRGESDPDAMQRPGNLKEGMAQTASAIMKISAMEQTLRREGCDTNAKHDFEAPSQRMAAAGSDGPSRETQTAAPMVDPNKIAAQHSFPR